MNSVRFAGQTAVVTGGAEGIGKAIAKRLAQEGARVALLDSDSAKLEKTRAEIAANSPGVLAVVADVSDEESVKAAVGRVVNETGRLDVAVNSAGIPGPSSVKITDYPSAEFDRVLSVNLRGSFLLTKYAVPPMLRGGYGRILLIASIAGKEGNPGMSGYAAAKAGVIGLAKAAGKEFAGTGITVNAMAPAVIRTALLDQVSPDQIKYMVAKIPMGRTGELEEAAALAAWVVSKECSFTTGFTFDLSGGRATY